MAGKFYIRRMQSEELKIAIDWAKKEGWNPGLSDWQCFYQADPQGHFIGILDDEPIASGSAVKYDNQFAFCGLYIVKEGFREHGYGMQLTQERLKYVGNCITGIDGVVNNVSKYQKIGYVVAHKNIRYALTTPYLFSSSECIVDLKNVSFKSLERFDRNYFPAQRSSFLSCWIKQPNSHALAYLHDQQLQGYGVIRKCVDGYKIGPLFARSPTIAQQLFEALCAKVQLSPIYLDIPEPNQKALQLADHYKMQPVFEVMRMYRNGLPALNLQEIYGITTYELG